MGRITVHRMVGGLAELEKFINTQESNGRTLESTTAVSPGVYTVLFRDDDPDDPEEFLHEECAQYPNCECPNISRCVHNETLSVENFMRQPSYPAMYDEDIDPPGDKMVSGWWVVALVVALTAGALGIMVLPAIN